MVGWNVKPFGELFSVSGGRSASRAQLSDIGHLYLHYGDIHASKKAYIDTQKDRLTIPRLNVSLKQVASDMLLQNGDIVFVDASEDELGAYRHIVIRNPDGIPFIAGLHTIVAKPLTDEIEPLFREYCFQTEKVKKQFKFYTAGTKVIGISKNNIKKIDIFYPASKNEQQAIAMALSDVDELIDSLENLIEKKKAIKQGAMQELLTGRKRLNKFEGKWEVTTLGKMLTIAHGKNQANVESRYGKYPILATGGVIGKTDTFLYNKESVLIGRKGTIDHPLYMNTPFWTIDTLFYTMLSDNVYAKFIYYLFCLINWNLYNEASGVPSLNAKTISNIVVKIPDIKEQRAIATALSDMDTEIEALTQKLEKSRQIKQGMMQELLTGRIRLLDTTTKKQKKAKATKTPKPELSPQSHNEHFHEAVILSTVVSLFASDQYPLGRFRRQKLAYLLHRHAQESTQGFLKKAAGPYNPTIRYKDESIALKANYVVERGKGKFVKGEKNSEAVEYFVQWYGTEAIEWLGQFQYRKNDDLEVLTTVAEAIVDLKRNDLAITLEAVKQVIRENPEWRPKLDKDCFSDFKIQSAIKESQKLFG